MAPRYAREVGSEIWKHKHPGNARVFVFQISLLTSPRPKAAEGRGVIGPSACSALCVPCVRLFSAARLPQRDTPRRPEVTKSYNGLDPET